MQWYSISLSKDEKIIGTFPQTDGMGPAYNLKGPNSVWNLPNLRKPDFEPDFDCFRLDKKSKLTDVISTAIINACGFIISDKLKNIFDEFKLPPHIYYAIKILHKNEIISNYYWLHFTDDNTKDIDFSNSEFIRRDPLFVNDFEKLGISNIEDLYNERKKSNLKHIFPAKLKIAINPDFLLFGKFWNKYYISDTLRNKIKNCDGFEFTMIDFKLM